MLPKPQSRVEQYLNHICTGEGKLPQSAKSRSEEYLDYIAKNGGIGGGGGGTGGVSKAYVDSQDEKLDNKITVLKDEATNVVARLDNVESELEAKANEVDVRKKNVLITEYDISDTLKQQINGNAPILQTIGDKTVTKNKTTFYKNGKNLFNIETATDGYFVNQVTGQLGENAMHISSYFIPVEKNKSYIFNGSSPRYALYDANYVFIAGGLTNTFTTTSTTYYVRFSTSLKDNIQLEPGTNNTSYEKYYCLIPYIDIESHTHDLSNLTGQINEDGTVFFEKSTNMINKATCKSGFVSGNNGNEYTHATYYMTDFVEIDTTYNYCISISSINNTHCCSYDSNKTFISALAFTGNKINIPSNAKYVRFTLLNVSSLGTIYMCKGDTLLPYDKYGYYLKSSYIKPTSTKSIIINLPSKLYALVGEEFNIYYDNILEGKDTDYIIDVNCTSGMQMDRCYRLVPTAKGEISITINVYSKDMILVGSKTSKIIVSSKTQGSGVSRSVIVLGDSTTNNGMCITKLNENFSSDVMDITTLGTRGTGKNKHEGRSGWKYYSYFNTYEDSGAPDVFNAFYNPTTKTFDYQYYCNNSRIQVPNYFFINLGINDTFGFSSDADLYVEIEKLFTMSDEMVKQIHEVDSNVKIGIVITIPPNYSQDAFGKAYNCNQYRDRYKRNNILWVDKLIKKYDNRESEKIYLIPLHCNLDTKYNFGLEEIQVNKRNSLTYSSPIANGGVHPVESGYWQCADTYWFFLKSFES